MRPSAWAAAGAALTLAACGAPRPIYRTAPFPEVSRPAPQTPPRTSQATPDAPPPPPAVAAGAVWEAARPWLGVPYRYGGHDRRGIDCSALTQNVLGDLGAALPRTVQSQTMHGQPVSASALEAGDIVFFRLGSAHVNHVGVMLDRNRFVHASSSRGVVVDLLMDGVFARRFAGGRRVVGAEGSIP